MNNFTDIISKAKQMQEKMKEVQQNLKKIEVTGKSGGDLVKVTLTGDYEMKTIFVDENIKKEKGEIINGLIIAAYHDAKEKLKKKTSEELAKATGTSNLPFDIKPPL